MKKLLSLMLILSACTSTPVKPPAPEVAVVALPTEEVEVGFADPTDLRFSAPAPGVCGPEYLEYLTKFPVEKILLQKEYYRNFLAVNEALLQQAILLYALKLGKVSDEIFVESMTETRVLLEQKTRDSQTYYRAWQDIEYRTLVFYHGCQEALEKLLKSKKMDPQGRGCIYRQTQAYIEDPFAWQTVFARALVTEQKIQDQISQLLDQLNKLIDDPNSTAEQTRELFKLKMAEINTSGILEQSEREQKELTTIFVATTSIQEECEVGKKPLKK